MNIFFLTVACSAKLSSVLHVTVLPDLNLNFTGNALTFQALKEKRVDKPGHSYYH
jgi:hypothetical protein